MDSGVSVSLNNGDTRSIPVSLMHAFDTGLIQAEDLCGELVGRPRNPLYARPLAHFSVGKHAANFQHGSTLNLSPFPLPSSKRTGPLIQCRHVGFTSPLMDWLFRCVNVALSLRSQIHSFVCTSYTRY